MVKVSRRKLLILIAALTICLCSGVTVLGQKGGQAASRNLSTPVASFNLTAPKMQSVGAESKGTTSILPDEPVLLLACGVMLLACGITARISRQRRKRTGTR